MHLSLSEMVHLIPRLYRRKSHEFGTSSSVDTKSGLDESDGAMVPNKETTADDTAAEPVSAMSFNKTSTVKPKSKRFWKFLNSLVPKMLESDSEDEEDHLGELEEDDSTGLEQPALSESTPAEEQEEHSDGDSVLSELAFGPSLRDGADDTLTALNTGCDDTIEETKIGWKAEFPQLLTDRRSRQSKITPQQHGVGGRAHEVEAAATSGDDDSDLQFVAPRARASRSSHFGGSAPRGLLAQACQGKKNVGGEKACKVASRASVCVVTKDDSRYCFLSDPTPFCRFAIGFD